MIFTRRKTAAEDQVTNIEDNLSDDSNRISNNKLHKNDKNNGKNEDDKSEEILKENEKTTIVDNDILASKKLASIQNSCKYRGISVSSQR